MPFVKSLIRYTVIAGLVGGAAIAIAGPDRMRAMAQQVRGTIHGAIDKNIKDPVALRAQLRTLAAEYPERIGEVRADLSELKQQSAQLEQELSITQHSAMLASRDLDSLQTLISRAEQARGDGAVLVSHQARASVIRIVYEEQAMTVDQAYSRAKHAQQSLETFNRRIGEIERDIGFMSQQEKRLADLLVQLETERADFQNQLWQLDSQVDAVARNNRLIEIMEKRQATIDRHSRYRASSLDQIQSRLAELRSRQEAQLENLTKSGTGMDYEQRAKLEVESRRRTKNFDGAPALPAPSVIEIRPEGSEQKEGCEAPPTKKGRSA